MTETPELLTPVEVSMVLKCTVRHVYHLVERNKLVATVREPKLMRISRNDLNHYITKGQPCANS